MNRRAIEIILLIGIVFVSLLCSSLLYDIVGCKEGFAGTSAISQDPTIAAVRVPYDTAATTATGNSATALGLIAEWQAKADSPESVAEMTAATGIVSALNAEVAAWSNAAVAATAAADAAAAAQLAVVQNSSDKATKQATATAAATAATTQKSAAESATAARTRLVTAEVARKAAAPPAVRPTPLTVPDVTPIVASTDYTNVAVAAVCGTEGITGKYSNLLFRFYTRAECAAIGVRVGGKGTEYNAATGECINLNEPSTSSSLSRVCATQANPTGREVLDIWDTDSTGNCTFHPGKYAAKYGVQGDIGKIYEHWLTTGIQAGFSPCGDKNHGCRWNPDEYTKMNPKVLESPLKPLDHYKTIGIKTGLPFCKATGFFSVLNDLLKQQQKKELISVPASIQSNCVRTPLVGTPMFANGAEEVYQVIPGGGGILKLVPKSEAKGICTELNATLATYDQLRQAQLSGADWCSAGWVADSDMAYAPITTSLKEGCGNGSAGLKEMTPSNGRAAVHCYGVRPTDSTKFGRILPFNQSSASIFPSMEALTRKPVQWNCSSLDMADTLLKGPANPDQTYLNPTDYVCHTNDPSDEKKKKYYCRTSDQYTNGEDATPDLMDDYTTTCDKLVENYVKLDKSIRTLSNLRTLLTEGKANVNTAKADLTKVRVKLECDQIVDPSSPVITTCQVVDRAIGQIGTYYGNIDASYAIVSPAVEAAIQSRTNVKSSMDTFQCEV